MRLLDQDQVMTGPSADEESLSTESRHEHELVVFIEDTFPRLRGAFLLRGFDVDEAEDLAQETLTRVVQKWAQVRTSDSPIAWTFRVGHNLASSRLRRVRVARRHRHKLVTSSPPEPDTASAIAVRTAVTTLPGRQREAVVLRYFAGLSVDQTAAVMGCAPGTVKALSSQGVARLRPMLDFETGEL